MGFSAHRHPETGALAIIPPMQHIPAGPFLMGSDRQRDPNALPNEFPQHTVSLCAFHIGRYPVTVAEYACALEAGADQVVEPVNWQKQISSFANPVHALTWDDAQAYTRWLSAVTSLSWRLPSEAEWEKAARGEDERIYPWGDTWDVSRANGEFYERYDAIGQPPPETVTTGIDAYPMGASPHGLLDMVGNVGEWTSTIWDERAAYPYQLDKDRDDPLIAASRRMIRGGSCLWPPHLLRVSYRGGFSTWDRFDWLNGMRLALSGDPGELLR